MQDEKRKCLVFPTLSNVTTYKQKHNFWTCKRAIVNRPPPISLKEYIFPSIWTFSYIFLKLKRHFSWLLIKSIWWEKSWSYQKVASFSSFIEKSGTLQTVLTVPCAAPLLRQQNWIFRILGDKICYFLLIFDPFSLLLTKLNI